MNSSVKIARMTRLGELAIGFLILSVATTLPELMVSSFSIISHVPEISIGNIFGSNIANIGLIIGLVAIFFPIVIKEETLKKLAILLFIATTIPIIFLKLGTLSKFSGVLLILVFLGFTVYSIRENITLGRIRNKRQKKSLIEIAFNLRLYRSIFVLLVSLFFLMVSSGFVVNSAANIALILGISETIIGATIIAIGTSLPEFTNTFTAVREGHIRLGLGNTIGACVTNLTLVLGIVMLVAPFNVNIDIFSTLVIFAAIMAGVLWIFLGEFGRRKLDKMEGLILVLIYVVFLITTFGYL